jgi:predicted nucleotidyltransferase
MMPAKAKAPPVLKAFRDAVVRSDFEYPKSVILAFEGGSVMHGASVGSDDHDYYGVYVEPPAARLGLTPKPHHVWSTSDSTRRNTAEDVDLVLYSLTKFAKLASSGNPTILHFLWVENALGRNRWWDEVIKGRPHFLARSHLDRFIGYANAQLDRLTGRRARKQHRPELIEQYGFDTKAAMHLMRLMYEAYYLMRDGKMSFPNPDATHLIEIRNGRYTLEQVLADFERLKQSCLEAQGTSPLPEAVNLAEINKLLAKTYQSFWDSASERR